MRQGRAKYFLILPLLLSTSVIAGEIKGVVRDSKTNKPLADTSVAAVSDSGQGIGMTDANGNYTISNLPAGNYTVQVAGSDPKSAKQATVSETGSSDLTFAVSIAGEVVEITGTRIRMPNQTEVSPVSSVTATEINAQGSTSIENVVVTLPQAFLVQGSTVSNGSNGTATVSLRGLGVNQNLILLNGRRIGTRDLNFIPTAMIERIDVLTGGASAVYGADAMAGVVNFVTMKDFEGLRLNVDWSMFQHNQQNQMVQNLVRARAAGGAPGFIVPGDQWNLNGPSVNVVFGLNSPDKKGHITAYASYRLDNPIFHADRDFSACALGTAGGGSRYTCAGSGTANPANIFMDYRDAQGDLIEDVGTIRGQGANAELGPFDSSNVYNFGPINYFRRPDERYSVGSFANYEIAPWAEAYAETMYMIDKSKAQIAPSGTFFNGPFTISCDNPLLSQQQRDLMCSNPNFQTFDIYPGRRNVEGGGRNYRQEHSNLRTLIGLRGDIDPNWNYDAFMHYTTIDTLFDSQADFNLIHLPRALDVVATPGWDPNNGADPGVCRSVLDGTDPACLPYNLWQDAPISADAIKYLLSPGYGGSTNTQRVVDLNVSGKLGEYGVRSPLAKDGIGISLGGQWRNETVNVWADYLSNKALLAGQGGPADELAGKFDVWEAYTEARIPLIQNLPVVNELTFEGAYRFSHYSFDKDTHTFKAGLDWEFYDGMRLRGSYQRAVRAPSIGNLFSPRSLGLWTGTDPCAGLESPADDPQIALCETAFGLNTQQVLDIQKSPADQYNGIFGGNPNVNPETGDTFSAGFVAEPDFAPGLSLSVDYWNIAIKDAISGFGPGLILEKCIETASPVWCDKITRDPARKTLWLNGGFIESTLLNVGSFETSGIDINLGYKLQLEKVGLENMGSVRVSMVGTWVATYASTPLPDGSIKYDCVSWFGGRCGTSNPEWRHKMRVTWDAPYDLSFSGQWRFFSAVNNAGLSTQPDLNVPNFRRTIEARLGGRGYLDLFAAVKIAKAYSFSLGVNNVFDTDPPLNILAGNANTDPEQYDALGRYIFMSGTADF